MFHPDKTSYGRWLMGEIFFYLNRQDVFEGSEIYEGYFLFISLLSLVIAAISLNHSYRKTKRTVGDSIKHELKNMPPYESEEESSTILVKNVGNTKPRIYRTCVLFDWDPDLKIELDYECDEDRPYILPLNGEKPFHKTLPSPPTKGEHFIEICTCTHDSGEAHSNEFRTFF